MNITELTVKQLAKALEQKELSARDAAEAYFPPSDRRMAMWAPT